MSIVNSIETVRDWLTAEVCPLVKLKLPDDNATDASYPYKLVNPAAFSLFVPSKDRTPPNIAAPIPSVCVQIVQGDDDLLQSARDIKIRLCFSAWDPGYHGPDIFKPKGDGSGTYIQQYNEAAASYFVKNGEGWRDAWNFVDTALRLIENAEYLGDLRVIKEKGITFGPVTEQDAVPDFYPYWFAWAEFSVEETLTRNPKSYQHLLYRELGLYAEDPDPEVGEVLYCYGNCGDLAEWIPPSGGATIVEKTIDIVTAIGTATNVTAYIPADAYATKEDYETYKAIALGAQATAEEALALARQAIAIAQAAEASVNDLSNAVGQNTSKIATLWDAVFSEITTNPFQITFADLTGITLTAGIWNSGLQRLEC